ncbi:MAG: response regulator transcription factor [Bacillota bacterium]|nr:response regulator transcription factor [Bacillota bacterium]
MRILVVEDDRPLNQAIRTLLEEHGFASDGCYDGAEAVDYARSGIYDCIVLDVLLPSLDGFEVLRRIRGERIQTPVLMLTALSSVEKRVEGLDSGADYYLTKPFHNEELVAAVRAVARRTTDMLDSEPAFGDLTLDTRRFQLSTATDSIELSNKEFQIMQLLFARPGVVVPKEEILVKVWGLDSEAEDNHVEVYISFLRKKLAYLNTKVEIRTLRKLGYMLRLAEDG